MRPRAARTATPVAGWRTIRGPRADRADRVPVADSSATHPTADRRPRRAAPHRQLRAAASVACRQRRARGVDGTPAHQRVVECQVDAGCRGGDLHHTHGLGDDLRTDSVTRQHEYFLFAWTRYRHFLRSVLNNQGCARDGEPRTRESRRPPAASCRCRRGRAPDSACDAARRESRRRAPSGWRIVCVADRSSVRSLLALGDRREQLSIIIFI